MREKFVYYIDYMKKIISKRFFISCIIIIIGSGLGAYVWIVKHESKLCFYNHLIDAININKSRNDYYLQKSQGMSQDISRQLINSERSLIWQALWIDMRAQKFIRMGTPIVCDDFVDMGNIKTKEHQSMHTDVINDLEFEKLKKIIYHSRQKMQFLNDEYSFKKVSDEAFDLLLYIENIEKETDSNLCMTKHVVESLGLASVHAKTYSQNTDNEVNSLARDFIRIKILGLSDFILNLDKDAQEMHSLGIGIICNDVPHIPFKEEYLK